MAVYQPGAWGDALDPDLVNATLADWSFLLDALADEQDRSVVEAARSANTEILQAAADAFDPLWTHASLSPSFAGPGGLASVHGGCGGKGTRFAQGEATSGQGGMTGGLRRLLERAADPFLHVTGHRGGQPKVLRVTIGGPPEILIENRRDPMATILRLAVLPKDARFVAPWS